MKRFFTLFVLSLLVYTPQSQAGFFDDLGKDLSLIGCGGQRKKLFESVVNNQDPSKPQIWSFKLRKGQLVENPNPRQWATKYAKEDLKTFCWEARKSRYVQSRRLEMFPAATRRWYCGQKVYTCVVGTEGGDSDGDNQNNGNPDSDDGGDSDSDDGGDPDSDDGGDPDSDDGGDPDSDDGGRPDNF